MSAGNPPFSSTLSEISLGVGPAGTGSVGSCTVTVQDPRKSVRVEDLVQVSSAFSSWTQAVLHQAHPILPPNLLCQATWVRQLSLVVAELHEPRIPAVKVVDPVDDPIAEHTPLSDSKAQPEL